MALPSADFPRVKSLADLLAEAASPPGDPKEGFGGWRLDGESLCLFLEDEGQELYDVSLERCHTSAAMLDWIMQVCIKTWATDTIIAGLVRALNHYLNPQGRMCSGGLEGGPIDVQAMLR